MQLELEGLRKASTAHAATDLPVMLATVLSALPAGQLPHSLDYAPGQLRLQGLVLTPADLQALANQLRGSAYSVKVQGPTLSVGASP